MYIELKRCRELCRLPGSLLTTNKGISDSS